MAAGLILIPAYNPAFDRNGDLISGALMYVYEANTTNLVTVYADYALTEPTPNPVVANTSGQFISVYAEAGTDEDPVLYRVVFTTPDGAAPGNPYVFDFYQPNTTPGGGGSGGITSVNGNVGPAVVLNASDVGAISTSQKGALNGVASLDSMGKVPTAQLPAAGTGTITSVNGNTGPAVTLVAADVGAIATTARGAANGVASLDGSGLVPSSQLPPSGSYKGAWNATTNTPTITSGSGVNADFYVVNVPGTTVIDGYPTGGDQWEIGDTLRFSSALNKWERIADNAAVSSVNGQTGAVVIDLDSLGYAFVRPEKYGAVGNSSPTGGGTNDYTALLNALAVCIATGRPLLLSKFYKCNSTLSLSGGTVAIYGTGVNNCGFVFGSNVGLEFTGTNGEYVSRSLQVANFAMISTNQSSAPLLKFTSSAGSGGTNTSLVVQDMNFTGADTASGFASAINLYNARNVNMTNVRIMGDRGHSGYTPVSAAGIVIDGNADPVEFKLTNIYIYFVNKGIQIIGDDVTGVEGLYFDKLTMVGCFGGIYDVHATGGQPLLFVTNSHFNNRSYGIWCKGRTQASFLNNNFANFGPSAASGPSNTFTGIIVDNNSGANISTKIRDNLFFAFDVSNVFTGITVRGTAGLDTTVIGGNQFDGAIAMTNPIVLEASADNVIVDDDNVYINAASPAITNSAGVDCSFFHYIKSDGSGTGTLRNSSNGIPLSIVNCSVSLVPNASGVRALGTDPLRWSILYGVQGDFSGNLKGNAVVSETGFYDIVSSVPKQVLRGVGTTLYLGGAGINDWLFSVTSGTLVPLAGALGGKDIGANSSRYGTVYTDNAPNYPSDSRLKEEVAGYLDDDLKAAILSVPMRAFTRIDQDDKLIQIGPYAQDIVEAFASVGLDAFKTRVVQEDETGYLSIVADMWQNLKLWALES